MKSINPFDISKGQLHQILLSSIAPRPIAFASTVDKDGKPNLSPFSFYNVFGYNPTTLIFSPSRRGRDNTVKHTYENILEVPEVVLNAVTYSMVEQMSLSSTEYDKGVDEFIKAGFTPIPSELVRPMRVKESPVQFECKVRDVIETGDQGGAGILIVCEVLLIHVDEEVVGEDGKLNQEKLDLVGRLGGNLYCRTVGDASFTVRKPLTTLGMGVDQLPDRIRLSKFLTGNHLGMLGNTEHIPSPERIAEIMARPEVKRETEKSEIEPMTRSIHLLAGQWLDKGDVEEAFALLMGLEQHLSE